MQNKSKFDTQTDKEQSLKSYGQFGKIVQVKLPESDSHSGLVIHAKEMALDQV